MHKNKMSKKEEKALTILFSNLKGRKKKIHDWIMIAENVEYLTKLYGSSKEVAKKLSMSNTMINSILRLLSLTEKNKQLVRERKILQDAGEALASIEDSTLQNKIGDMIVGLKAHDARDLIQFAKRYPNASIERFKEKILKSKRKVEKIYVTVIPLDENNYYSLKKEAKKRNIPVEELSQKIIKSWLSGEK